MADDLLAEVLALPAAQRLEFITKIRAATEAKPGDGDPVRRPDDQTRLPVSPGQQAQWFAWRYSPGSALGNVAFCYELAGELSVAALHGAVNAVVARHEIFRTTYAQDTEVVAVLHPHRDRDLPVFEAESRSDALSQADTAARIPFDLRRSSPLRVRLWRFAERHYLLLLVFHHIAVDEQAVALTERDLAEFYRQGIAGMPLSLPEPPVRPAILRSRPGPRSAAASRSYWHARLAEARVTKLPADRPRPAVASFAGDMVAFSVAPAIRTALIKCAAGAATTRFAVLLAVFAAFLAEQASASEVVIGTPVSGRAGRDESDLVGFFLNTVVLRIAVDLSATFTELIASVIGVVADAWRHELPFAEVTQLLGRMTQGGYNPVFNVMFIYLNADTAGLELTDLAVSARELPIRHCEFDLVVSAIDAEDGLQVFLRYSTDLFDPATVLYLADRLTELIGRLVTAPAVSIAEIMGPSRRHESAGT